MCREGSERLPNDTNRRISFRYKITIIMENIHTYTVSIYTENNIGLLNRISAIFQRRHINIESINTSVSEIENVSKWAVVVKTTEMQMKKIIGQIEKQVEVIKAYYHTDKEIVYQESCLFKLNPELLYNGHDIQDKIKACNARIIEISKDFFVIEKSGSKSEITDLYNYLYPLGIMQFTRSGRIVISKKPMEISSLLAS